MPVCSAQAATTLNATFALAAPPEATCPAGLPANCSANQLMRRDTCFAAFDCGPVSPKLEIGPILPESPTMVGPTPTPFLPSSTLHPELTLAHAGIAPVSTA